jgi:hypothetical protein
LKQLCDADESEFKEICDLVGMSAKPLHVKRFRKALDDFKLNKQQLLDNSSSSSNNTNLSSSKIFCIGFVFKPYLFVLLQIKRV